MPDARSIVNTIREAANHEVSLHGVARLWEDPRGVRDAFEHWSAPVGRSHGDDISHRVAAYASTSAQSASASRQASNGLDATRTIEVWARWPSHWRLTGDLLPGQVSVLVIAGFEWTISGESGSSTFGGSQTQQAVGNPVRAFLDPAPLSRIELPVVAEATRHQRKVWRLKGVTNNRRVASTWPWLPWVTDYGIDVDQATGLVVALTGYVAGEPTVACSFDALEFGVQLSDTLFAADPPVGGGSDNDAAHRPRHLTLPDAVRNCGYRVFRPTALPTGGSIGNPMLWDGVLWIIVSTPENPQLITMRQRAYDWRADSDIPTLNVDGDRVTEADVAKDVRSASRVRVVRDGTLIELAGDLPSEYLTRVAESLTPVDAE